MAIDNINNPAQTPNQGQNEQNFDTALDAAVVEVTQGRVYGDPHFLGQDGGQYDIQGSEGDVYNILSDSGVQVNALFEQSIVFGEGYTLVSEVGITTSDAQIHLVGDISQEKMWSHYSTVTVNGTELSQGESLTIGDTTITMGNSITVTAGEYTITFDGGLTTSFRFSSPNANADGVLPHGLWGQTVDEDDVAVDGINSRGKGAQGEGVIEGEITQYKVANLFDVSFENHNRFNQPPTDITLEGGSIAENATAGDEVGTLVAIDPDEGEVLEYEMLNDPSGFFEIDKDTGKILVAAGATLDFETANTHDITVQVKDSADHIFTKTVTLTVTDVNEAPTAITIDDDTIPENANIGAVVGTLTTADPDTDDTADYLLIDNAGGRFVLGGANMDEIHVAAGLDFETNESHDIEVQVTDSGGLTHIETITINVDDVIENNPPTEIIVTDDGAVDENSPEGTVAAILSAAPFDAGDVFTYTLVDDPSGFFEILDGQNIIRVKDGAELNHEEADQHVVKVVVDDGQGGTHAEDITITVTDVNEQPTDIILTDTGSVPENSPENTIVGLLNTIDPDDSDSFEYTLIDDAGGRFKINPGDNHIRVAANADLNFEDNETHTVTVEVEDSGGLKRTKTITINVIDVKEAPEDIIFDLESIDKNAPAGTIVATMSVKDDAGDTVRYELVTGSTDYEIRDGENVIRVKEGATLTQGIDNLQVKAIDTVNADHFLIEGVAITVDDAIDPPTGFNIINRNTFSGLAAIAENSQIGTVVADLLAVGGVGDVIYTLTGADADNFSINKVDDLNSEIRVNGNLNFEQKALHELTIEARFEGTLISSKEIKVRILNEVEEPTEIQVIGGTIPANAIVGQTVAILAANDDPQDGSYTYTLQGGDLFDLVEIVGNRLVVKEGATLTPQTGDVIVAVDDGRGNITTNMVVEDLEITTVPPDEINNATIEDLLLTPDHTLRGATNRTSGGGTFGLIGLGGVPDADPIQGTVEFTRDDWQNKQFPVLGTPVRVKEGIGEFLADAVTEGPIALRNSFDNAFLNDGVTVVLAEDGDNPEILGMVSGEETGDNDFVLRFGLAFSDSSVDTAQKRAAVDAAIAEVMPWAADAIDFDTAFQGAPSATNHIWEGVSWEIEVRYNPDNSFDGYYVNDKKIDPELVSVLADNPVEFFTDGILAFGDSINRHLVSSDEYTAVWQEAIDSTDETDIIPSDDFATWEDLATPTIGVLGGAINPRLTGGVANPVARPAGFLLHNNEGEDILFGANVIKTRLRTGSNIPLVEGFRDSVAQNIVHNMNTGETSGGIGITETLLGRSNNPMVMGFLLYEGQLAEALAANPNTTEVVSMGIIVNPSVLVAAGAAGAAKFAGRIPGGGVVAALAKSAATTLLAGADDFARVINNFAAPWVGVGWNVEAKFEDGELVGFFKNGKEINLQLIAENFLPEGTLGTPASGGHPVYNYEPNSDEFRELVDGAVNGETINIDTLSFLNYWAGGFLFDGILDDILDDTSE